MGDEACTAIASLTVRVTVDVAVAIGHAMVTRLVKRGSSGMTVDFISRSCSGLSVYCAVGITQCALMGDEACTAIPP